MGPASTVMDKTKRIEIISAYGKVLEECPSPLRRESDLPFSKELISEAIVRELTENPDSELLTHLEIAYVELASFLPNDEFNVIEDFKHTGTLAEEIARSGSPRDIIASAQILKRVKGEKAVRIQEKISEKMRTRLNQMRALGMTMFTPKPCS